MTTIRQIECCLSSEQQKHLRNLMLQGLPNEVCGVVFEHDIIVQYPNTYDDPEHGFSADIDTNGAKAIWHSHPSGQSEPSEYDLNFMAQCEAEGYRFRHIIVTVNGVFEYEVIDGISSPAA